MDGNLVLLGALETIGASGAGVRSLLSISTSAISGSRQEQGATGVSYQMDKRLFVVPKP